MNFNYFNFFEVFFADLRIDLKKAYKYLFKLPTLGGQSAHQTPKTNAP